MIKSKIKSLLLALNFTAEENSQNIYIKQYSKADNYLIKVDLNIENGTINYGNKICIESKTSSNFAQAESLVVLECVNRLLETGYKPENIILEKTWKLGHQEKGRLDILVTKTENSETSSYLMIECKTAGKEFEKELKNTKNNGGQLFSYFQQDKSAEVLMLYTSELKGNTLQYRNEIIKIEEDYRNANNVIDIFNKWNKITKPNGIFENIPYNFRPNTLKITDLKDIHAEESGYIFNRFLEILRHNVVSDKPNAFNKIFNLFLCKIYDEKSKEGTDKELDFQWKEGIDENDYVDFQIRLTDLYKEGMWEFLEKKVTDFTEKELEKEFREILPEGAFNNLSQDAKEKLKKRIIYKLRLEKNNEFAIKEVFDGESARENAKVLKEIVELLQGYKLRYTKKQQYLSDFFELLLTTGLKQEAGQFFTPVPVAQFIIKSIPLNIIIDNKLSQQKMSDYLPYIIDYAAGSGHFLTESMHEIQKYINGLNIDELNYNAVTKTFIKKAQDFHFDWAFEYIYGIEKDYRLVKVGKVGCYLHGDGLANVIHSDGLANFKHKDYKGKLKQTDEYFTKKNKQFDIVVSNPPYSVEAFKNASTDYYTQKDFELYQYLTDQSSEIEALFVERTKQLLKDGGTAGIILPSSILSNTGIYTKAREIILQDFDIVAIAELGSNTFMATGTNTVVLFLRRRDNYTVRNLSQSVEKVFETGKDVTLHGIENALSKYLAHVWNGLTLDDYVSILKEEVTQTVEKHELFQEYYKKLFAVPKKITQDTQDKARRDFYEKMLETEKEKFLYFLLTYKQKVVLVKSGQKDEEKRFLGYEFSNRRGKEGIHPIQKGKRPDGTPITISDCTKMFDETTWTNLEKASTYVYKAFLGEYPEVHESLQNHISHARLVDMLTFDRADFEKLVSTNVKKKVTIESKWELVKLGEVAEINYGTRIVRKDEQGSTYPVYGGGGETFKANSYNREDAFIISRFGMSSQCVRYVKGKFFLNDSGMTLNITRNDRLSKKYLNFFLFINQNLIYLCGRGVVLKNIDIQEFKNIKLPLPPLEIQQKIVSEIEELEQEEEKAKNEVERLKKEIGEVIENGEDVAIKSIVEINPKKTDIIANFEDETEISFLAMEDVSNDGKILNLQKRKLQDVKTGFTFFQNNDVIIAKITPCMENGKGALIENMKNNIGFGSTEFFVLRTNGKILPKLLHYHMQKKSFRELAAKNMTGTSGHKRVSKIFLEDFNVPLPPLDIQQKIVAQIEAIEDKIVILENELAEIPQKKEEVLKRYL